MMPPTSCKPPNGETAPMEQRQRVEHTQRRGDGDHPHIVEQHATHNVNQVVNASVGRVHTDRPRDGWCPRTGKMVNTPPILLGKPPR